MKAYLNKMPMMKEVLRNELEFIKKQHTKIKVRNQIVISLSLQSYQ